MRFPPPPPKNKNKSKNKTQKKPQKTKPTEVSRIQNIVQVLRHLPCMQLTRFKFLALGMLSKNCQGLLLNTEPGTAPEHYEYRIIPLLSIRNKLDASRGEGRFRYFSPHSFSARSMNLLCLSHFECLVGRLTSLSSGAALSWTLQICFWAGLFLEWGMSPCMGPA